MVFVSVYKKKTSKEQDFIILLYHHAVTLMRFDQKMMMGEKEIICCKEEEAMVLNPFMAIWWLDNGADEIFYGLNSLIPAEDRLFVEHLAPRWMLDPEIYPITMMITMISTKGFQNKINMGLLSLCLRMYHLKKVDDDVECKVNYDRVIAARKKSEVIDGEEKELHEVITRTIHKYEIPRQFRFWLSLHNPPQIRYIELH